MEGIKSHSLQENTYSLKGTTAKLFQDADLSSSQLLLRDFTVYPSAFITQSDSKITKHYYAGTKRIASRIEGPTPINSIIRGQTMIEGCTNSTYELNYKFNAKELDAESGMYYYGARYYDPRISVWMSVDPMWEKYRDFTPFNYCGNNPLLYIDPNGMNMTKFGVKDNGEIKQIGETDNKPDQLFAITDDDKIKDINNDGKITNKDYTTIYDKSLLPWLRTNKFEEREYPGKTTYSLNYNKKTGEYTQVFKHSMVSGKYSISNSKTEAKKVFTFAASNSNVEWGMRGNRDQKWIVGYLKDQNAQAPNFSSINGFDSENIIWNAHSHSGSSAVDFKPSNLDLINAISANCPSYLFMPKNPIQQWKLLK